LSAGDVSIRSALLGLLDFLEDSAVEDRPVDDETGDPLDPQILDEPRQELVDDVFEELTYRASVVGASYPFALDKKALVLNCPYRDSPQNPGQIVYLFCLLASGIRDKRFAPPQHVEQRIGNVFQICGCLAAGAYVGGEVASFGFPRASGTDFLPALREAYARFGAGAIRADDDVPEGLPTNLKDGGIDVIAWQDLPDTMPGKLYLIGQCASGKNWRDKSVVEYVPSLHGHWFTQKPAEFWVPAMFTIFPLQHELEKPKQRPFLEVLQTRTWSEEMRYGIIFDRLRISHLANLCMTGPPERTTRVDGVDRFGEIESWVQSVLDDSSAAVRPAA